MNYLFNVIRLECVRARLKTQVYLTPEFGYELLGVVPLFELLRLRPWWASTI